MKRPALVKEALRRTYWWGFLKWCRDALECRFRIIYSPRRYWEAKAHEYVRERLGRAGEEQELRTVLSHVASYHPRTIVEVGCSFGRTLRRLAESTGALTIGIDFSSAMLAEARKYAEAAALLVQGTGDALPLLDEVADVVCTFGLMMHVPPDKIVPVVHELCRVARVAVVCLETAVPFNGRGYDFRYGQLSSRIFGYDYRTLFEKQDMICVKAESIGSRLFFDFRKW